MKLNKLTHDQLASLGQSLLDMSIDEQDDNIQLEQKAIGSRKWTKKDPEAPFDLLNFEYRSTGEQRKYEGPRLKLKGNKVLIFDTEEAGATWSRSLSRVRALFALMQQARSTGNGRIIYTWEDGGDRDYSTEINANGDIRVGCQYFTFSEVHKFLKSID
jgi:hypothetical protein